MSNEILIENARLREALAKIGGFANSWAAQHRNNAIGTNPFTIIDRLNTIETTCKAALETPATPQAPLTYVMLGGTIYAGNLVSDTLDADGLPDEWVTIEIVDVDPSVGRMSVTGPLAVQPATAPPETVGSVE